MKRYFSGTLKQIRFILKRERINGVIWIVALAGITAAIAAAYSGLFPTREDLLSMAGMLDNPAMTAMLGPVYGLENLTVGGLFSASMLLFTVLAAALMNIFLVIRHTRGDEEKGRTEIIRSLPAGRLSNLAAAMTAAVIINLGLALITGFALAVLRIESITFGGSMLYGFCLGACGLFFASVTAVFAQISQSSRGATGLSAGALGLLYLLRAAGDTGNGTLSMVSPLGIALRAECFVKNIWWPPVAVLAAGAVFAAAAFYLNSVRDLDRGLLPQRQGRKEASALLRSPAGLAFRLLRNTAIAWAVSLFAVGIAYGSVMGDMESFISGNEFFKNVLIPPEGHTQTEMFITMIISMMAVASAIPAAGGVLKLAGEEKQRRSENILSKAASRQRVMAGYTVIAFAESLIMPFVAVLGLWAASAAVMDAPIAFGSLFSAVMVYLPAVWATVGIAAFLTGIIPDKASAVTYGYLGFSFALIYLGRILSFPAWTKYFSPFGYILQLPMDTFNILSFLLLTAAAGLFAFTGFLLYRRRDLI